MAPLQKQMRLSTGAKGNVVNKKALVSMKQTLKEHSKKNKALEAALANSKAKLADEKAKSSKLAKEKKAFEVVAQKGLALAKTAYGERASRRVIFGKARGYIARKGVPLDPVVVAAISPMFKWKNLNVGKCEKEYQEIGKNAKKYVVPVPIPKYVAEAQQLANGYRSGPVTQAPQAAEVDAGEEEEGAEQEAGSETEEE